MDERLQHNMRRERKEKQPADYAPIGGQCGSRKTHTSVHKHTHLNMTCNRKQAKAWDGG